MFKRCCSDETQRWINLLETTEEARNHSYSFSYQTTKVNYPMLWHNRKKKGYTFAKKYFNFAIRGIPGAQRNKLALQTVCFILVYTSQFILVERRI